MDILKHDDVLDLKSTDFLLKLLSFIDCNYNYSIIQARKNEYKARRGNKTLVTFYIKDKLTVLMIFGKKERALFERASSDFSDYINTCYNNTKTFHDGKWMMIDIHDDTHVSDIINLIKIKKKPNPKSVAMCGYKCDLCKAYAKNIEKNDERIKLSAVWAKYNNLDISPEDIYCDGCRSKKKNAKLIDDHCPLRKCVALKNLNSCIDCLEYPCENFNRRRGLCEAEAKEKLKTSFCKDEFNDFLLAYDNKTRIDKYKKYVGSKFSDNK